MGTICFVYSDNDSLANNFFVYCLLIIYSTIFGKQRIALIIEIIYIVARLISLIIGIYIQNFVWAIILFSFVSAVVLMAQLTWYLLLVKKYEQSLKTI